MATSNDRSGVSDLRDYLTVLRRRTRLIVAVTTVVVASAVILSLLQDEVYASKGRLLVARDQSVFNTDQSPADPDFAQTEIELIESEAVRSLALETVPSAPDVSAVQVGTTAVVEVSTESTDPKVAAAATKAYMNAYLDFRRRQATDALASTSREIQATIDQLQAKIDDLSSQLRSISCPANSACPARDALEKDRDSLLTEQVPFRQRLGQLNIEASAINVGAVVSTASVPDEPVRPTPLRNGALALGLGLVLGVALALAFEYLDDSVRDAEDLEKAIPALPILAMIPPDPHTRTERDRPRVVALGAPTSPSAEAYRSLRTSLHSLSIEQSLRWLQVTSATDSEGKTTTAANLGFVLSRTEERVIIVSWDLRRPRLHDHFGISNELGLTSVLLGEATLAQVLQPVTSDRQLWVLPAGPVPPNPSDLLYSARAREVLAQLREDPATVVFDCPPVLPVADASILAEQVDGTVVVARAGVTTRKRMARAIGLLRQAGAPVLGTVLHVASNDRDYDYAYRYADEGPGARRVAGPPIAPSPPAARSVPATPSPPAAPSAEAAPAPLPEVTPLPEMAPSADAPRLVAFAAERHGDLDEPEVARSPEVGPSSPWIAPSPAAGNGENALQSTDNGILPARNGPVHRSAPQPMVQKAEPPAASMPAAAESPPDDTSPARKPALRSAPSARAVAPRPRKRGKKRKRR